MSIVLHVEDNETDVMITKIALSSTSINPEYITAKNGQEGLRFLQSTEVEPDLILLDINMPVLNGKEFLEERNKYEAFKKIPVVMLTTSNDRREIRECYDLNANAYLIKTMDYNKFIEMIDCTLTFWLAYNEKS